MSKTQWTATVTHPYVTEHTQNNNNNNNFDKERRGKSTPSATAESPNGCNQRPQEIVQSSKETFVQQTAPPTTEGASCPTTHYPACTSNVPILTATSCTMAPTPSC